MSSDEKRRLINVSYYYNIIIKPGGSWDDFYQKKQTVTSLARDGEVVKAKEELRSKMNELVSSWVLTLCQRRSITREKEKKKKGEEKTQPETNESKI